MHHQRFRRAYDGRSVWRRGRPEAGGSETQNGRIAPTGEVRWTVRRLEGADNQTDRGLPLWRRSAPEDNGAPHRGRAWHGCGSPERDVVVPAVVWRPAHRDPSQAHGRRRIVICVRYGRGLVGRVRTGGVDTGQRAGNRCTRHETECRHHDAGYTVPPHDGSRIPPASPVLQRFSRSRSTAAPPREPTRCDIHRSECREDARTCEEFPNSKTRTRRVRVRVGGGL